MPEVSGLDPTFDPPGADYHGCLSRSSMMGHTGVLIAAEFSLCLMLRLGDGAAY